jgi:hypothetical protein
MILRQLKYEAVNTLQLKSDETIWLNYGFDIEQGGWPVK